MSMALSAPQLGGELVSFYKSAGDLTPAAVSVMTFLIVNPSQLRTFANKASYAYLKVALPFLSRSTLIRAVSSLVTKGYLSRVIQTKTGKRSTDAPNQFIINTAKYMTPSNDHSRFTHDDEPQNGNKERKQRGSFLTRNTDSGYDLSRSNRRSDTVSGVENASVKMTPNINNIYSRDKVSTSGDFAPGIINNSSKTNITKRVPRSTQSTDTAKAALQTFAIAKAATRKAADERSKLSPLTWSRTDMQAVLDRITEEYAGTPRLVVTAKMFGLLRKRMKESLPADFKSFLRVTVSLWSMAHQDHIKYLSRKLTEREANLKALRSYPNFNDLCIFYPYLLRRYLHSTSTVQVPTREAPKTSRPTDGDAAALRKRADDLSRANRDLQRENDKVRKELDAARSGKPEGRQVDDLDVSLFDERYDIPTWEEGNNG